MKAGEVVVEDTVEAGAAHRFAEVLHTDTAFVVKGAAEDATTVGGVTLRVEDKPSVPAKAVVESNVVMGPGRPGSVDKGTPEARGERLVVTTDAPVETMRFAWTLTY